MHNLKCIISLLYNHNLKPSAIAFKFQTIGDFNSFGGFLGHPVSYNLQTCACFGVPRLVSAAWYMLERDDHGTYTHESALTRRMWYSTVTPTTPDMRRVSWGQSAQTTTREVSFAYILS